MAGSENLEPRHVREREVYLQCVMDGWIADLSVKIRLSVSLNTLAQADAYENALNESSAYRLRFG